MQKKRKFESYEEAMAYLKECGDPKFFGRVGTRAEQYIYVLHLRDGRSYHVDVYEDGTVIVKE